MSCATKENCYAQWEIIDFQCMISNGLGVEPIEARASFEMSEMDFARVLKLFFHV